MVPKTCGIVTSEKRGRIKVSLSSMEIESHQRIVVKSKCEQGERRGREGKGEREKGEEERREGKRKRKEKKKCVLSYFNYL